MYEYLILYIIREEDSWKKWNMHFLGWVLISTRVAKSLVTVF